MHQDSKIEHNVTDVSKPNSVLVTFSRAQIPIIGDLNSILKYNEKSLDKVNHDQTTYKTGRYSENSPNTNYHNQEVDKLPLPFAFSPVDNVPEATKVVC